MAPKTPEELRKQIEAQQKQPSKPGHERTAEGKSVETPKRGDFYANLDALVAAERPTGRDKKQVDRSDKDNDQHP